MKNSFYDDVKVLRKFLNLKAKLIFENPEKKPILGSDLIDHLALDGHIIKAKGDLSEVALFKIDK